MEDSALKEDEEQKEEIKKIDFRNIFEWICVLFFLFFCIGINYFFGFHKAWNIQQKQIDDLLAELDELKEEKKGRKEIKQGVYQQIKKYKALLLREYKQGNSKVDNDTKNNILNSMNRLRRKLKKEKSSLSTDRVKQQVDRPLTYKESKKYLDQIVNLYEAVAKYKNVKITKKYFRYLDSLVEEYRNLQILVLVKREKN